MALSSYEKELLAIVVSVATNDENMIRNGIIKALRNENERGRRNYLWRTLERAAKAKIRRARRKLLPENFRLTS